MSKRRKTRHRSGSIYIAVLGTAMIVGLLGMSAMIGQRLQNRMVSTSGDVRQAQLNANTAIELGLLAMKSDTNWRTTYSNGNVLANRATNAGTCTLTVRNVPDPGTPLSTNSDDPVILLGVGNSGDAIQRAKVTIDPRKDPLSSLRYSVATGGAITLQSDTLRTAGVISSNTISATSAQVYGKVEATSATGSSYNSGTTIVTSAKRPAMPDWTTVFSYYRTNGVSLDINSLPSWSTINLARNAGIESSVTGTSNDPNWIVGPIDGNITATIDRGGGIAHSGLRSLRVRNRSDQSAGPAQPIDGYVKPAQQYYVEAYVYHSTSLLNLGIIGLSKMFRISIYTKGSGDASAQISALASDVSATGLQWTKVSGNVNAPSWNGNLQYAFVKFMCTDQNVDFYLDDVVIRETTTGHIIYQKVLSPSVNQLYASAPTDPSGKGIYWIDCNNNKLIIERSRILGTLLVVNPGAGSCISNGPIRWSPAVAGYPALLVDADTAANANFSINATNRVLSEKENATNYNPVGAPDDEFGQDSVGQPGYMTNIYRSSIKGLIAVRNNLTFQNRALVRGEILAGGAINSSSGELEIDYQPDALLNPPPGFTAPYSYYRRTNSLQKAVSP
jgi:hypothetical protein